MDDEHHRPGGFQPLFVGLLGIIGGAIMVATYHCVATVCCTHRHSEGFTNSDQNDTPERPAARLRVISHGSSTTMKLRASSSVLRYGKEIDAGTCAICLTDFKEEEDVRVLPECLHVFHVPCIDMWLVSHPNCPLCRANAVHTAALLPESGGGRSQELHRLQNIRG